MDSDPSGRREFLRKMTALGAAGLPLWRQPRDRDPLTPRRRLPGPAWA